MRTLRIFPVVLLTAFSIANLGCERTINALTSNPDIRKNVNEKGKASCMQASLKNQEQPVSAALTAKLDSYCDCITVKGLSQFSNAELMELGFNKEKMKEPKYQLRMQNAAKTCHTDVFHD